MMKFDEFDQYSEDMLMAQYDVSEIIRHELMKGEVREDFLIATLESCSTPSPTFVKGTISDGVNDAGQLDIVLCRPNSHLRRLGSQCLVGKDDSLCVIEVKGNCTGRDLKMAEQKAAVIQTLGGTSTPLYGVICYKSELQTKTIMNRFGFSFDRSTDTFFDNALVPNEAEVDWRRIEYPNLDFFASLAPTKKLFLRRYEPLPGVSRFIRLADEPLIKNIFAMMRSLWLPANPA
jgi:hypothetical protein